MQHQQTRWVVLLFSILVLAVPATASAVTIFADDFDRPDSNTVGNGWIVSEDHSNDVAIRDGRLRIRDEDDNPSVTQILLDTTDYENISISFEYESFAGSGDTTEPSDLLSILYDHGDGFEVLESIQLGVDGQVFSVSFDLPADAGGIPDLGTRLALAVSTDWEGVLVDNFVVSGDRIAGAMPEPSAALVFGIGRLMVGSRLRRR